MVESLIVAGRVALLVALTMMCAACTGRAPGGEGTTQGVEGTTAGDAGSSGTTTFASGDDGSTGAAVECPPPETSVTFSSKLLDGDGEPVEGEWGCVVEAVELTDGALEIDLDCPVESGSGLLTRVSVATNPPLTSHGFVVGETVRVHHFRLAWSKLQRIERPDRTLLLLAEWGWSEIDDRGVVDYGEVVCHTPDPVGRVEYTDVEFDAGEGVFVVPAYGHAEQGAYAAWTGNTARFVPEKSTVKQYFDLEALVIRRAP